MLAFAVKASLVRCKLASSDRCYTNPMLLQQSRQPVHISWLVALLCLGMSVGLLSSSLVIVPVYSIQWLVVAVILFGVGLYRQRVYIIPVVLIAGCLIGLWRASNYLVKIEPYHELIGQTLSVRGKVREDSDIGKRGEVVIRLGNISVEGREIAGSIWVSSSDNAEIKRGDVVTVRGKVAEGFGSFAASIHSSELLSVERPVPGDIALRVRDWFAGGVRRSVPDPEASLGIGYLVGQRRSLPEELDNALQVTGLTHVVVASGYNLTVLVGMSRRLLLGVSKFLAIFLSSATTVGFVLVAGISPSMSRAGLVTALGLLAWYYGRKFHPVVLLTVAAAVTLIVNPSYGQGDLGWQLSFTSFAGVLILAPLLQSYFFGATKPSIIRQVFFETTCAWICTVPLIILAFGQFSNVAILANLLVLPLIPLAMILTFIAGSVALLLPATASIVGLPALLVLGYMTRVASYLGDVSWAQTTVEITPYLATVYYIGLVLVCGYIWQRTKFSFMESATDDP